MELTKLFDQIDFVLMHGDLDVEIEHLAYHSKKVKPQSLFVCINGTRQDASQFINEAIENGAVAIVTENRSLNYPDVTMVYVDDIRKTLALLSCRFFDQPARQLKMVGITGTKGKTTVAVMIYETLKNSGIKVGLMGTNGIFMGDQVYPSENTTPESYEIQYYLREMVNQGYTHVILEVTSIGIMRHRVDGFTFDIGCFTNLSPDHIGENEHSSFEEYKHYKMELMRRSDVCFINRDDFYAVDMINNANGKVRLYDLTRVVDEPVSAVDYLNEQGLRMRFLYKQLIFTIPLPGKFNVSNALLCIGVCEYLGIDAVTIKETLKDIHISGRSEFVETYPGVNVFIDFAHNALSMENILKTMLHYQPKRLITLFGCGGNRDRQRRYEMGKISGMYATLSIITSDNSRYESTENIMADIIRGMKETNGKYVAIEDRKSAIEFALQLAQSGDMILILGKGHEQYQELNGVKKEFIEKEVILECLQNKET